MSSRYFDFRLALGIPVLLMVLLLAFEPSPVDFALARLFYQPGQGFIGRSSFWLEDVLHDRAKQALILLGVLAIAGFVLSLLLTRLRAWRRQLGYLVLALGLFCGVATPAVYASQVQVAEWRSARRPSRTTRSTSTSMTSN